MKVYTQQFMWAVIFSMMAFSGKVHAQTLSLHSYYPSPFGIYSSLRLMPQAQVNPCDPGTLYVESTNFHLYICDDTPAWEEVGVWTLDLGSDEIYAKDFTNPNVHVGIRTNTPDVLFALDVVGDTQAQDMRLVNNVDSSLFVDLLWDEAAGQGQIASFDSGAGVGMPLMINEQGGGVGVGTAAVDPSFGFHVDGNIKSGAVVSYDTGGNENDQLQLGFDAGNDRGFIAAIDVGSATPKTLLLNNAGGTVAINTNTPDTNYVLHSPGDALTQTQFSAASVDTDRGVEVGYNAGDNYGFIQSFDYGLNSNMRLKIYPDSAAGGNMNVAIGTNTNQPYMLFVNGSGAYSGALDLLNSSDLNVVNGNVFANVFYISSDTELKENIKASGGLDKILRLDGVSFTWKENGKRDIGLLAQNVEETFPELVKTNPHTNYKAVKYLNLIGPIVEAVKEQQSQLDAIESDIERIKSRVNEGSL